MWRASPLKRYVMYRTLKWYDPKVKVHRLSLIHVLIQDHLMRFLAVRKLASVIAGLSREDSSFLTAASTYCHVALVMYRRSDPRSIS